jgi:glycerophosphoryl diester phosphodiesterase
MANRFAFLDHDGPLAFAHRGGAHLGLENTKSAFADSIARGFRYLETDVHATSDGVLVAFHDSDLDRVTDRNGVIEELTWAEVSLARVGGREPIPTLAELLEAFPTAHFNIDMKQPSAIEPLAAVLQQAGAVDRVLVAAFSDQRLRKIRRLLGPQLCTSKGPMGIVLLRVVAWLRLPGWWTSRVPAVQVPVKQGPITVTDRRFVDAAHARGVVVHVWTIDDPAEMDRLLDLGVDGIMTDRPDVLRDVLARRGQWQEQ